MAKISELEKDNNNIHPSFEDKDYIEHLKKSNYNKEYIEKIEKFNELLPKLSDEELDLKIEQLEKSLDHVNESLNAQKFKRTKYLPSNVLNKTAFTKGLLEEQIKLAKDYKTSQINKDNIQDL